MALHSKEFIKKQQRKAFIKAVVSLYVKKEISYKNFKELIGDTDREEIEKTKRLLQKQKTKRFRESKKIKLKKKLNPQKPIEKIDEPEKKEEKEKPKKKKGIDDWIT